MKRSDIDVALLSNALDNEPLTASRPDLTQLQQDIAERLFNARLSRRRLLQLSAGVSLSGCLIGPLARAAARFELTHIDGAARFDVGGVPLFSVSVSYFDGDPKISVRQGPDAFVVRLTRARFPGTAVPADFVLAAERVDTGWAARLRFGALDFDATFSFEQWLLGHSVAHSSANLSGLFVSAGSCNVLARDKVEVAFLPNWTLRLRGGDIPSIRSDVGHLACASAQVDLVPAGGQNVLLATAERPRTRLWVTGALTSTRPVAVEPLLVTFLDGRAHGLLELASDAAGSPRSAWSVESDEAVASAGRLLVADASGREALQKEGLEAQRLRVTVSEAESVQATAIQASLRYSNAWCRRGELQVELSTDNAEHSIIAAADGAGGRSRGLVVTRIVAPLAGADQAVFIRRGFKWNKEGSADASEIVWHKNVDDLRWLKGFHPIRREVPLDEFDLRITRGYDGFDATLRFRDIHLVATLLGCHLQGSGTRPLIEFDVGPQHVQEEARYESDLPLNNSRCPAGTANTDEPILSDEEICDYTGIPPADCRTKLDNARKNCPSGQLSEFEKLRRAAVAKYRDAQRNQPEADLRFAHSRFSESSWLTFELKGRSGNRSLDFSLPALFEWDRPRSQRDDTLTLVTSPLAAAADVTLDEQIAKLKHIRSTAPRSIGQKDSSGAPIKTEQLWSVVQAPYRLAMTPVGNVKWKIGAWKRRAASTPVEMWSAKAEHIRMRAVWTPDRNKDADGQDTFWADGYKHWPNRPGGFRSALDARDRHEIVSLTSGFGEAAKMGSSEQVFPVPQKWQLQYGNPQLVGVFVPKPFDARLLMLTSFGASLKSRGTWSPPAHVNSGALTVQLWDQNSTIGRDTKVVVEYKGFLFPLGTPCVLVKETERRLVTVDKCVIARLVQRFFIRVPTFSRTFVATQQPFDSRAWPFPRIVTDRFVTPDLEKPECSQEPELNLGQQAFWPTIAANQELVDFPFDDAVNKVKMVAPMLFVDNDVVHRPEVLNRIVRIYRRDIDAMRVDTDLHKQPPPLKVLESKPRKYVARVFSGIVRFAPPAKPGDTSYRALQFLLDVDIPRPVLTNTEPVDEFPTGCALPAMQEPDIEEQDQGVVLPALYMTPAMESEKQPPFFPHLRQALIEPGQIAQLSGQDRATALVEFDAGYLHHGFDQDANAGEIFLRFVDKGIPLSFSGNTSLSGGVASPSTQIAALSRKRGPIGGDADHCNPQKSYYRYPQRTTEWAPARLFHPAGTNPDPDPVAAGRLNNFDAREFFAKTLGDAKLLGVVRFVDILDVALKVSGNKFPTMIQEVEHAISDQVARAIVPEVQGVIDQNEVAAVVNRVPRLKAAAEDLKLRGRQLLAGVGGAPGQITQLATQYGKAAAHFADEIKAVASDPKSLWPPDALKVLAEVEELKQVLEYLFSPEGADEFRDALVARLGEAFRAELTLLTAQLAEDPRFIKLVDIALAALASLDELERNARVSTKEMIRSISRHLEALLKALIEVDHWSALLDREQTKICTEVATYADELAKGLRGWADKVYAQAVALNNLVETIKKQADTLSDQAAVEQIFKALSDVASSALAHASDFKTRADKFVVNPIAGYCAAPLSDAMRTAQRDLADLLNAAFRGAQEALRKAPRLNEELNKLPSTLNAQLTIHAAGVDDLRTEIAKYINAGLNGAEVIEKLKALQEKLSSVPKPIKPAAEWLSDKIGKAVTVLNELQQAGENLQAIVNATREESTRYANEQLQAIIVSVISAEGATRQLLQESADRMKGRVLDTLYPISWQIGKVFGGLNAPLNKVRLDDASVRRWLAPPLRERIVRLKTSIGKISRPPNRDPDHPKDEEDALIMYFKATLPDARDDLIALADELRRVLGAGDLGSLVDMQRVADEIIEKLGVPTTARLSYDWATELSSFPEGAGAIFVPLERKRFSITAVTVADLRGRSAPTFTVNGYLDPFSIKLLGETEFLTITFRPLTFTAGSGRDTKMNVEIATVDFGGGLTFVKKLQEWLSPKSGIFVELARHPPGVIVGYRFHEDIVRIPAFTLQNVSFSVACLLPFDNTPALIKACVGQPDKPVLLSAGIYGGGAFVCLTARVEAIQALEASFEYGLVTAFKFGIASGTGRITAGVYIRIAARNAVVAGFFNASGNADIAGLITIGAEFRVQVEYSPDNGRVSGYAHFNVTVKIGFFEANYGIDVAYARQGEKQYGVQQRADAGGTRGGVLTAHAVNARQSYEARADAVLAKTPVDERADQSTRLLQPELWNKYWSAFEGGIGHECR